MNEAISSQSTPQSGAERSAGTKAKQLSRTAAERARELRKVAARQRVLRQKLRELEESAEGPASEETAEVASSTSANGDLLAGLANANWDEIKEQLDGLHREAERYIRENPTKSVLVAVGAGFVLGLLMKK